MRRSLALALATAFVPALAHAQSFTTQKFSIGGDGGFDYLTADPSGRVYVSRGTHVMIVDAATGKVLGDIPDTPRVHGIAIVKQYNHGFTTNGGDSTLTMFDATTGAVISKIHAGRDGLDGIMYDDADDKVLTIDHSRPMGSAVVVDPKSGTVVATIDLTGRGPEGGVADGKGHIFINLEDKNAIDVVDTKTWKVVNTWDISPCDGPTGIAMDRTTNRIFAGCSKTSVVIDANTGKVVAQLTNGDGVDALGFDAAQKLIYIPAGRDGNVSVYHEDSPDKYTLVATVPTMQGARTLSVDPNTHIAYVFTPEYGPAPAAAPGDTSRAARFRRGPILAAWLIAIKH